MSRGGIRKFTYDSVFTEDGRVVRAPEDERVSFTLEEIREARRQGFAEGEAAAATQTEPAIAQALQSIVQQTAALASSLDAACETLRRDAIEVGLAGAQAAAEAAIKRCPEEAVLSLFRECAESLRGAPVIVAHAPHGAADMVREKLQAAARQAGIASPIDVREGSGPARIEWSAGAASIDPAAALAQAREAAERWLSTNGGADQLALFEAPR